MRPETFNTRVALPTTTVGTHDSTKVLMTAQMSMSYQRNTKKKKKKKKINKMQK